MELPQIIINIQGLKKVLVQQIQKKKNVFDKLNKYFYTIHAHGNNWIKVIDGIPDVLELTFINKRCVNNIELNKIPFPQKNLDYPNTIKFDEIILDYYPFVNK